MRHVVGNITWNSNGWTGPLSEQDRSRSGFGNVQKGYIGNESWNLCRSSYLWSRHKYGSFENAQRVKTFSNKQGIVFFWSSPPKADPVFVGLYAQCELLDGYVGLARKGDSPSFLEHEPEFNLRVPVEPFYLIQSFEHALTVEPQRHLADGDGWKKRPGQIGFCYIDDSAAARIVNDAIEAGNDGMQAVKQLYGY